MSTALVQIAIYISDRSYLVLICTYTNEVELLSDYKYNNKRTTNCKLSLLRKDTYIYSSAIINNGITHEYEICRRSIQSQFVLSSFQ